MMALKIAALAALAALAVLGASAASAQTAEQKTVAQIDETFVCPEALPGDEARSQALKLFPDQAAAAKPDITIEQLIQFRVAMLRKHQCNETLANLGVKPMAKPPRAPGNSSAPR